MNPPEEQNTTEQRSRRGQTLAEFALTLPILLLLMFGVIEFARIFHAWITLQNSARTAARYAITGQWDENSVIQYFPDTWDDAIPPENNDSPEEIRWNVLNALVPCKVLEDGADVEFEAHWGKDCIPGDAEDEGLRADMARLPSILDRAREGAAGLNISEGDHIVGLGNPFDGGADFDTSTVNDDQRGWYHVWICSTRPRLYSEATEDEPNRYTMSEDRKDRICEVNEGALNGSNQYDAGGPGDAVEIVVFFNHPLITPLGLVDFVPLQARRVMINESFRSTRVVNLPSDLIGPTWTPSHTPTDTDTPVPTDTPEPSATATDTPEPTETSTLEPTPPAVCDDLAFTDVNPVQLVDDALQIGMVNSGTAPFFLSAVTMQWRASAIFPEMYASQMRLLGRASLWSGNEPGGTGPVRTFTLDNPYVWYSSPPDYDERRIDAGTTYWQMRFSNGPASGLSTIFRTGDFSGTELKFSLVWGGNSQDCVLSLSDLPLPTSTPDTPTPEPPCSDYLVTLYDFLPNGVVQYRIRNGGYAYGYLTGFSIDWDSYDRSFFDNKNYRLDYVKARGSSAYDPDGVMVWNGTNNTRDSTSPVVANSGSGAEWKTVVVIEPGETINVWLEFDNVGGNGDFDSQGVFRSDFNDTQFILNDDCVREGPDINTPTVTNTPTITNTPKPTNTPTKTHTPTNTVPPTATNTPGPPKPTNTNTPRPNTPTNTVPPEPTATNTIDPGGDTPIE